MLRLKSRQLFIPNGFVFYLPQLKWQAPRMASFDTIVSQLERLIAANPALAQKHCWPTHREAIADWVDRYNAQVCASMGWDDYIITDQSGSIPKSVAPPQSEKSLAAAAAKAKELVSGAKSLMEWDDSGDPPVDRDRATARAAICVACPLNQPGDWTQWFTVPAAELIKRRVARVHDRGISTIYDEKLKLCAACYCPLQLKVHVPLPWILKRMSPDQLARLQSGKNCWILHEKNQKTQNAPGCCGQKKATTSAAAQGPREPAGNAG